VRDVIIVGAGISGLRAAELLSTAGLDVLVLEKNKSHGGSFGENMEAFPEYHYSSLDFQVPSSPVRQVSIFTGNGSQKRKSVINFERPVFRLVKRGLSPDSIDSYLLQRSRKASAKILFGDKFVMARKKGDDLIEVETLNSGSLSCRVLIAADGVFSTVRKVLGLSGYQKTEGVGYIAKVEGANLSPSETIGIFNYKRWPGSYCYLLGYPNEKFATAGITVRPHYADRELKKYFDSLVEYLPEILGSSRIEEITKGFVTLGSRDRILSVSLSKGGINNILFIGEAGGFQDPTLAFGLAPALLSARIAADSVIQAFSEKDLRMLNQYSIRARHEIVKDETRRISFRYILEALTEEELVSFLTLITRYPTKVETVMTSGEYLHNFLPLILKSASRNPKFLAFPFRYVRVSRSLKARYRRNSVET
jgi:flavin-dependent dehydrogenase